MAVTQTVNITDTSGDTHATADDMMTKMNADVSSTDSATTMIESCMADGTLHCSSILSDDGKSATITRVWADACWTDFSALTGASDSDFADAGWTVASQDTPVIEGLTTRQDDAFGTDQDEE